MNRIKFNPAELGEEDKKIFDAWIEKAEKARQKAIEDFDADKRPMEFKEEVWGELKKFLMRVVFHNKCAYCDSKYDGTSFGDAEHFRPKRGVTVKKNGKNDPVMENGEAHPGYYWLAYDWHNLLPACERCNSAEGKMNQFPIKEGKKYVFSREEGPDSETLDKLEEPLLLHPYREDFDPDAHLLYGNKGIIAAFESAGEKDIYGQATITTCDLKRGGLEADRSESQTSAWFKVLNAMNIGPDKMDEVIAPYNAGLLPHSRAAVQYVALRLKEFKSLERFREVKFAPDVSSPGH